MAVLCVLVRCDGPSRFPCGTFAVWFAPFGAFLWDAVSTRTVSSRASCAPRPLDTFADLRWLSVLEDDYHDFPPFLEGANAAPGPRVRAEFLAAGKRRTSGFEAAVVNGRPLGFAQVSQPTRFSLGGHRRWSGLELSRVRATGSRGGQASDSDPGLDGPHHLSALCSFSVESTVGSHRVLRNILNNFARNWLLERPNQQLLHSSTVLRRQ